MSQRCAREVEGRADARHEAAPVAGRPGWLGRGLGTVGPEAPPLLFALVHPSTGFWAGVALGGVAAAVVLASRAWAGMRVAPGIGGVVGLGVSAYLAHVTGTSAGSFLADTYGALVAAVVLAGSVVVRRPLAGVVWNLVRRTRRTAADDPVTRREFTAVTVLATGVYTLRFVVGHQLFAERATGADLVLTKLATGPPLTLLVLGALAFAGVRADRRAAGAG